MIRNMALLVAAVDAAITMGLAVYRPNRLARQQDQAEKSDGDRLAFSGTR
ncbi:MAG TPA: hypothetical protein VFJ76_00910 [Solirubrobacterales bacterium]|nr:hypothetical protein [Solirubrobacterales bacterium]